MPRFLPRQHRTPRPEGVEFVPILPSGVILFLKIGPRALSTQERAYVLSMGFHRPIGWLLYGRTRTR